MTATSTLSSDPGNLPTKQIVLPPARMRSSQRTVMEEVSSLEDLHFELPLTREIASNVNRSRAAVSEIVHGRDPRMLVIVGECAVNDIAATKEFAEKLIPLAEHVSSTIHIVMRVYGEKPRTGPGWTGMLNDPHQDGSHDLESGHYKMRELMLHVADKGLGVATEVLDPASVGDLEDLVSWSCIGARTASSQTHRQMAAAMESAAGIKNPPDGSLTEAILAIKVAQHPVFRREIEEGRWRRVKYHGNRDAHLVLRGGRTPNFDAASVGQAVALLRGEQINTNLIIDSSHGNSGKIAARQPFVFRDVMAQRLAGQTAICGLMLEASLVKGNQSINIPRHEREYGKSITDECIDFNTASELIREAHEGLSVLRSRN